MSKYNPRRPYDDDKPEEYLESDRDYMENNRDLCIAYLDSLGEQDETVRVK